MMRVKNGIFFYLSARLPPFWIESRQCDVTDLTLFQSSNIRHPCAVVNMAVAVKSDIQLSNYIRAEIILKRKDDDSILLWKCKSESKWGLPWFLLEETKGFREEIERWFSNQLGPLVSDYLALSHLTELTILPYHWCVFLTHSLLFLKLNNNFISTGKTDS